MRMPFKLSAYTDEELMQRAAGGSNRAFEELYNRHARRLQGFFARRLGNENELAADLTHDAFLRLYAARANYRRGHDVRAWLYTIAYNLCKNHLRNRLIVVPEDQEDVAADSTVEIELDADILRTALREALRCLPQPYAMLFSLHYEEELTVPQIARITELPEGTVKSRLHKAMKIIKKTLKQYENQ